MVGGYCQLQRVKELGAAMEVTSDNQHGLLEFMVPPVDSSEVFFPISSQFATSNTFNGVKVWVLCKFHLNTYKWWRVVPLVQVTRVFSETGSGDGGFVQTTHPITQNCQVVWLLRITYHHSPLHHFFQTICVLFLRFLLLWRC